MDQTTFKQLIDDVKARTDLVALVGRHVELRESGTHHVGRSLRHSDTTPSLVVWPATQTWRDFSGGGSTGGDCLAFVQYATSCSFMDALRALALDAGVTLPGTTRDEAATVLAEVQERRRLEDLLTIAANYYFDTLPGSMRWEYWQRGFSDETIDRFQLGFGRPGLWQHFARLGVPEEERLSTGLFVKLKSGEIADTFANRLVFPYWVGGRVVYFIGRRSPLSSDEPYDQAKYKKLPVRSERHPYISRWLRNDFFFGEDDARTDGVLLVCEGIVDAISAQQVGFKCVSPVTTSFRKQDHDKLLRLTARAKRVVIVNDSEDSGAGERGALETAKVLHAAGRDVRIATIPRPEGVAKIDVNDVVRDQGAEALRVVVESAKGPPAFLVDRIPVTARGRELVEALKPVVEVLATTSALERAELVTAIASRFAQRQEDIEAALAELGTSASTDAPLPSIVTTGKQQSELIGEAARALTSQNDARIAAANGAVPGAGVMPLLFARAGRVVGLQCERDQPRIVPIHDTAMFGLLLRAANWYVERRGEEVASPPPLAIARDLVTFAPSGLGGLDAVLTTPVFGRDGSLLNRPGYHASDRLWLHADGRLGASEVPAMPSAEQIARARSLLVDELFVDFPFVSESDRAHAVAALLLPFARRLVHGCTPLHLVEAPTAGSGKGLLSSAIALVATGSVITRRTLPNDEDEVRKAITSQLLAGGPLVVLDNLSEKRTVDSAALAAALTSEVWGDRLLGQSVEVSVPNTATWLATANNVKVSFELTRRCVRIRIDTKHDMPWQRAGFRHDPLLEWVREQRAALVQAALTLVQAWVAAGKPKGKARLGAFESWASTMSGILEVAGIGGLLANSADFYERSDTDGEAWRDFTRAWWATFGKQPTTVAELNTLCAERGLLEGLRGAGNDKSQQSRLGRGLHTHTERMHGGLRIVLARDGGRKKGRSYAIEVLMAAGSPVAIASTGHADEGAVDDGTVDPFADDVLDAAAAANQGDIGRPEGTSGGHGPWHVHHEKASSERALARGRGTLGDIQSLS